MGKIQGFFYIFRWRQEHASFFKTKEDTLAIYEEASLSRLSRSPSMKSVC